MATNLKIAALTALTTLALGATAPSTETLTGLTYTAEGLLCSFLELPAEGQDLDLLGGFVLEGFEYLGGPTNGDEFEVGEQLGIEIAAP